MDGRVGLRNVAFEVRPDGDDEAASLDHAPERARDVRAELLGGDERLVAEAAVQHRADPHVDVALVGFPPVRAAPDHVAPPVDVH
eukprot:898297-Rhodomonas_salina.3